MPPRLSNLVLGTFLGIAVILLIFPEQLHSFYISSSLSHSTMSESSWSSPFEGWHERALSNPHPDPNTFTPSREALRFAVLRSAPVEPEGISLAFFSPPSSRSVPDGGLVAVDALGRVVIVSPRDAKGILDLAQKTLSLPATGSFRNRWIINQPITSQPIDRIFVPKSDSASLVDDNYEVSVQGFSKERRDLKRPVEGTNELPDALFELEGLVLEARDGASTPGNDRRNEDVLGKVRNVVQDLF